MNLVFIAIALSLIFGAISIVFLNRVKYIRWILFLINSAFQGYVALRIIFSDSPLVDTFVLPFEAPAIGMPKLLLQSSQPGVFFFSISVFITLLIAIFALSSKRKDHCENIASSWMILMAGNAGIFFAGDWITFLLCWEIVSWSAYFIISAKNEEKTKAGINFFTISLISTSALIGAIFIGITGADSFLIADSIAYYLTLWDKGPVMAILTVSLFAVSFFAKAAVFPFHSWFIPAFKQSADEFSVFLCGVFNKYGIFALIVFVLPIFTKSYNGATFAEIPFPIFILCVLAVIGAIWNAISAFRENKIDGFIAHSSVSQIGVILCVMILGRNTGFVSALVYLLAHSIAFAGLTLTASGVKIATGEEKFSKLGGLSRRMPFTFVLFCIFALSIAAIPPTSGFLSQWLVLQNLFRNRFFITSLVVLFVSTISILYIFRAIYGIFLGDNKRFSSIRGDKFLRVISAVIPALILLAIGIAPGIIIRPLNETAQSLGYNTIISETFFVVVSGSVMDFGILAASVFGLTAFGIAFYLIGGRVSKSRAAVYSPQLRIHDKIFQPVEDVFSKILDLFSIDKFFNGIGFEFNRLSSALQRWFNSPQFGIIVLVLMIAGILIIGRVL
jgi:NADH-quinone oxidoreductase subunit M